MKITCTQRDLAKAISIASRAVAARSTIAVLGNLLLEVKGGELHISATNMAMRIDCALPCKVEAEGAITVPARLFVDIISKLPAAPVVLDVNDKTKTLNIQSGSYKAKVNGIDAFDFPERATDAPRATVQLHAPDLRQMIDQVVFAASSDESRTALTGVEFTIGHSRIALAATDGYRLAQRGGTLSDTGLEDAVTVIVPSAGLSELARILAAVDSEPGIGMSIYERHVAFNVVGDDSIAAVGLTCSTIDAKFPDYHAIIPKSQKTSVVVDTKALLRSLQVARMFTSQDAGRVQLTIDPKVGTLNVRATDATMGDSDDTLQATVKGEPVTTYVNVAFLIDTISRIDEPTVDLLLNEANKPLLARPTGASADDFVHVIMPMSAKGK